MSIYMKLNKAREKFHTLKLTKTGYNKFAGYNYFELGDFLIPAMKVLDEFDLCAYISFGHDLATMRIVNMVDGSFIDITSPMSSAALKGCHEVQNLGAVQTYLRRYLWVAALEIVEHDALDATTGAKGDAPIVTPKKGIGDDLPEDEKESLRELALAAIADVKAGLTDEARKNLASANLEADQKVWLWGLLDSKTRSALSPEKKPANQPTNYMRA